MEAETSGVMRLVGLLWARPRRVGAGEGRFREIDWWARCEGMEWAALRVEFWVLRVNQFRLEELKKVDLRHLVMTRSCRWAILGSLSLRSDGAREGLALNWPERFQNSEVVRRQAGI
jgi:hypothetical protein